MIGGLAGGACAGIFLADYRKLAPRQGEFPIGQAHPVYQPEAVAAQETRLSQSGPVSGRRSLKAMRRAVGAPIVGGQIATRNVKHGIAV